MHLSTVEHIVTTLKPNTIILCGDYNISQVSWSSDNLSLTASGCSSPLSAIADSFSFLIFLQHNYCFNRRGSTLDLVFSNSSKVSVVRASTALLTPDTYHPPLFISLFLNAEPIAQASHSFYDFKTGDYTSISHFLNSFNWKSTFSAYSINDAASLFNDALLNSIDKFIPLKLYKTPKFPRWVSPLLKNMIITKKRAHITFKRSNLAHYYTIFSQLRAKCKRQSKLDYSRFIKKTENTISSNPSHFWKLTKDLKSNSPIPSAVHLLDESASSPVDSANLFSKYFLSVFKPPLPSPSTTHLDNLYPYNLPSNCHFSLDDVLSALVSLKNNNSNGSDGISACILYSCRNAIATPVFILFRRSLDEGIVPDVWKTCSITPIFNAGDRSDVSNYRPISILPHLAILVESIVYSCIKRNLNHIIIDSQHGFRPGKSTITSSISFTTYILNSFEANSQIDTIFTDIKKPFDSVDSFASILSKT